MNAISFFVVPDTDKGYVSKFDLISSSTECSPSRLAFGGILELEADQQEKIAELDPILNEDAKAFPFISYSYGTGFSVRMERQPSPDSLYDKVTVTPNQIVALDFARICAKVQKIFDVSSISNLGNLLGAEAQRHYEARDAAVVKLEKLLASLTIDIEESRQKHDRELQQAKDDLNRKYDERVHDFEIKCKEREAELTAQAEELESRRKELDDRAAKHARRQHYKDLKDKFKSWSQEFHLSDGTKSIRKSVFFSIAIPLVISAILAGVFLFQVFVPQDSASLTITIVKQVTFTLLFVSLTTFLIRWNNQWLQRHANEEFRLKRLELDIDRASWFVEMAFEWKDEKGEEIPLPIVERLTSGLFLDDGGETSAEPHDSLVQALLGASKFTVRLADGTEVEYDRKGVQRLLKGHR